VVKSLVENIEKIDLTPLEKAKAYRNMIEELDITQEELAQENKHKAGEKRRETRGILQGPRRTQGFNPPPLPHPVILSSSPLSKGD